MTPEELIDELIHGLEAHAMHIEPESECPVCSLINKAKEFRTS